jgi:acylglycerol lipase
MSENSNSSPTRKYSLWEELTAAEGGKFIGNYSLQEYKVMRGFIPSQGQLVKLYYTKFEPREPLASVAIIHGVGEGHESFMGLGGRLAEQGLAVHTIDFRGFGFSGGERGSYVFKDYMRDIEALINCCKRSIPLYVYAHGIGACILLTMLALNPGLPVSGVITTSLMTSLPCESPSLLRSLVLATPFFDELVMSTNVSPTSLTK